jgi:putative transposase
VTDREQPDDPQIRQALLRYLRIAEAAEAPCEQGGRILREAHASQEGQPDQVSLRTLERWLERYRKHGLKGLTRRARADKGSARAIADAAVKRAIALRKEAPERSTTTLIDILERSGAVAVGAVKRSTLDRHLDRCNASRRMLHVLGTKRHIRMSFEHPLDFVVADFHDGPYYRTDADEIRRAQLSAFIDHCSRYVPESRYGPSEDLMAVRHGLRTFCTRWGQPGKLYVDRGPGYKAGRFHFACAQLDIELCHSRPYTSEGRGVIERFNRTTKESFELEVRLLPEPPTLDGLNAFWLAWLDERYHRTVHSETGERPLERWQRLLEETEIRHPDPELLDEVLRLHAQRTVHRKTSTVEVGGVRFVVDTALRRRRVDVLYDPHDLSSVVIYLNGQRIERARPQQPGEHPLPAPEPAPREAPSVNYLDLLRRDHERRRAEQLSTLRLRRVPNDAHRLTLPLLLERVAACSGRRLGDVERDHATQVFDAISPLEVAIADAALKTAVSSLGHGLHASQYLNVLREHVLFARKKGKSSP